MFALALCIHYTEIEKGCLKNGGLGVNDINTCWNYSTKKLNNLHAHRYNTTVSVSFKFIGSWEIREMNVEKLRNSVK